MGYALARALMKINPDHKRVLEPFGFAGYDFRKK
jgi:ribosomal protein S9